MWHLKKQIVSYIYSKLEWCDLNLALKLSILAIGFMAESSPIMSELNKFSRPDCSDTAVLPATLKHEEWKQNIRRLQTVLLQQPFCHISNKNQAFPPVVATTIKSSEKVPRTALYTNGFCRRQQKLRVTVRKDSSQVGRRGDQMAKSVCRLNVKNSETWVCTYASRDGKSSPAWNDRS